MGGIREGGCSGGVCGRVGDDALWVLEDAGGWERRQYGRGRPPLDSGLTTLEKASGPMV